MWVDVDVRGQQEMGFFTGRSIIVDYGQVFWPEAMILNYNLKGDEIWSLDKANIKANIINNCQFN